MTISIVYNQPCELIVCIRVMIGLGYMYQYRPMLVAYNSWSVSDSAPILSWDMQRHVQRLLTMPRNEPIAVAGSHGRSSPRCKKASRAYWSKQSEISGGPVGDRVNCGLAKKTEHSGSFLPDSLALDITFTSRCAF